MNYVDFLDRKTQLGCDSRVRRKWIRKQKKGNK